MLQGIPARIGEVWASYKMPPGRGEGEERQIT